MWTPRSIDVLKNCSKFVSVCVDFAEENRRIAIFGTRTIFLGFALILLLFETDQNLQRFAVRLHDEIDASRFSGTEPLASISLIHPTARAHSRGDFAIRITTSSLFIGLYVFLFTFFFLSSSFSFLLLSSLPPPSSSSIDLRTSLKARWPRAKKLVGYKPISYFRSKSIWK